MPSSAHGTLTPNVVTELTVAPGGAGIVIINASLVGVIWVRLDGQDPQVRGADSFAVYGARDFARPKPRSVVYGYGSMTVRLLAEEALDYDVEAIG